jgi:hypothetical protein
VWRGSCQIRLSHEAACVHRDTQGRRPAKLLKIRMALVLPGQLSCVKQIPWGCNVVKHPIEGPL